MNLARLAIWKFRYWFFSRVALYGSVRTPFINHSIVVILLGLLVSCGSNESKLMQVGHYHLQSVAQVDRNVEMARGEQMYRLRGSVTSEERKSKLGHYFTVEWENDQVGAGDVRLVMEYLQSATGSKVLGMSRDVPDDVKSGLVEFQIAGESYRVGGRVLAWRIQLLRGDTVIANKQSYLWK